MKPRAARAVLLGLCLVLPACIGIGEDPDGPYEAADVLSIAFDHGSAGLGAVIEGQEFPVSIRLDLVDQERYHVAASHPFISEGLNTVKVAIPLDGFPVDPQDPADPSAPFGCLGPIELVDSGGETIMTVRDFCSSAETRASLRLRGDFTTGEDLGWWYRTPAEEISMEVETD